MTTDHFARIEIERLLSTVALNPGMVATAQQERDRGILEVLREIVVKIQMSDEALDGVLKSIAESIGVLETRVAALESIDTLRAAADVGAEKLVEQRLDTLEKLTSPFMELQISVNSDFVEAMGGIDDRLAAIEAWKEAREGDGK